MDNNEKPNYRRFDEESDKAYFAAYLNTAKQNVFIVFRDLSEKLGLSFDLNNDDNMMNASLWKKLKDNTEPELSLKIIERINEKFPYANYLTKNYAYFKRKERQARPGDYFEVFKIFIKQLYDFRNYYTHAVHDEVITQNEIIKGMQLLFDAARRIVKKRFELQTSEIDHLVRLERIGKRKSAKTVERPGFHYSFADKNDILTEKGFAFFVSLWLQRKDAQMFLKKLAGFKRSETPKEKATLETYTLYTLRLPKPKLQSDNDIAGVLLDMVNELKRCPKHLYPLLSEENKKKFLKMPEEDGTMELDDGYEALPLLKRSSNRFFYFALRYFDRVFEQTKFHIDLGNYSFHVYDKKIDGQIRKRRWIKKMTSFGNLDDFADDKRPKDWIDKIQRIEDRDIDSGDIYMTETTPHYHINNNNIGIKFKHNYKQLFRENKIWPELSDFDEKNPTTTKPRTKAPDAWLSLYELPAMLFYQLLFEEGAATRSIEKIIHSHIELINQFFIDIETGNLQSGMSDASFIDELNKRGIEKHFVPKPLIKYLTSKQMDSAESKAGRMLQNLIDETDLLIKKVNIQKGRYDKKPGAKDYTDLKSGNMADFLARDIIKLQKPIDQMKGKPNSTEFQVLQAKLAFFGASKHSLDDLFKSLNLIDGKNPHPFLHKMQIENCYGILDFYIEYLEKRKTYLEFCKSDGKFNDYHFLKIGRRRKEHDETYIKELAKKLRTENVINLPRGLFLNPMLESLLSNEKTKDLAAELKKLKRVNTAYIIEKYFTQILNDIPQEFYDYKKSYDFLNKLYDVRKHYEMRKTLPRKFFTTNDLTGLTKKINNNTYDNILIQKIDEKTEEELKNEITKAEKRRRRLSASKIENLKKGIKEKYWKKYKTFGENEKQIRLAKTCDMVLFMLVDHILRKNFIVDEDSLKERDASTEAKPVEFGKAYSLAGIKADSDKGLLELQTEAKIKLPYNYETNLDNILRKRGAVSVRSSVQRKTILREQIKIKNYGDFRALMKDRRISSLLPYLKDDIIHFEALKKELELYQDARIRALEKIQNFELKIIASKNIQKEAGKDYIKFAQILDEFKDYDPIKLTKAKNLRNAFCHSQYPDFILFEDEIDGNGFNLLKAYKADEQDILLKSPAIQFLNLTNTYYDGLIDYIAPFAG
jgi:hypothetical protein